MNTLPWFTKSDAREVQDTLLSAPFLSQTRLHNKCDDEEEEEEEVLRFLALVAGNSLLITLLAEPPPTRLLDTMLELSSELSYLAERTGET